MKIEIKSLYIPTTKDQRTIRVLLPDDYEYSNKKYPALYMHDGQNLFLDHLSYGGHSWQVYEALKKTGKEMIVVGIDNSKERFLEYSPWKNDESFFVIDKIAPEGKGSLYADFIVNNLIPMIESNYRVIPNQENRFIAGSSMGAYISVFIATKYKDMFSGVGVFSLASWFNEKPFLEHVENSSLNPNQKYFISIGRNESSSSEISNFNEIYLQNSKNLKALLEKKQIKSIHYIETDDVHNELAWRKLLPDFINFIS